MSITVRICFIALLACFAIVMVMAAIPSKAYAQNPDQELAEKKGLDGLFKNKGVSADDPRLAKPWQKYLALGSVAVTVILWKYL